MGANVHLFGGTLHHQKEILKLFAGAGSSVQLQILNIFV